MNTESTGALAEEMVTYRARHGMSQSKLAELCGINVMTINYIERGLQKPTSLTEAKIRLVINEKKEEN